MQKSLQAELSTARAISQRPSKAQQTKTVKSGPTELDASQLKEVGGGLSPNGSWAKVNGSPNGSW
jgi:hypothetical protein